MSQNTGREPQAAANQPQVEWDMSGAVSHTCNVANSTSGLDDIVLNFGATKRGGALPGEVSVQMVRRIVLRPLTARNLQDMLRNVIADIDADRSRAKS
jgi:hypothetical protein